MDGGISKWKENCVVISNLKENIDSVKFGRKISFRANIYFILLYLYKNRQGVERGPVGTGGWNIIEIFTVHIIQFSLWPAVSFHFRNPK